MQFLLVNHDILAIVRRRAIDIMLSRIHALHRSKPSLSSTTDTKMNGFHGLQYRMIILHISASTFEQDKMRVRKLM